MFICSVLIFQGAIKNVFASELQWDNEIADVEERLNKNQKELDEARRKLTGKPSNITLECNYQDNSLKECSKNFRLMYISILNQYLTPQLSSTIYIGSFYNLGGANTFFSASILLAGNTNVFQQSFTYTLGYKEMSHTPLTLGRNFGVDTVDYYEKHSLKGLFLETQLNDIKMQPWFARIKDYPDDYFFGITTNLQLLPSLNTELIFYNMHDHVFTSTLLGSKTKKSLDLGPNLIKLDCELNLSSDDEIRDGFYDAKIDLALLLDLKSDFNLFRMTYPLHMRYKYIGPNYLRSIRDSFTAVLEAWPEAYFYQPPEDNPYVYDYYANQKGYQANVGPVKIGKVEVGLVKEHYQDIAPLKPKFNCRSFKHIGGDAVIAIPKTCLDLIIEEDRYQTKRAKLLDADGIDLELKNSCVSLAYKLSVAKQIQVGHEIQTKAGYFNADLMDERAESNKISFIYQYPTTAVNAEIKFSRIATTTDSYDKTKVKIKMRTQLSRSQFDIIGYLSRNNMSGEKWDASLSFSQRVFF